MKIEKWDEINGSGTHEDRLEAFLESANDSYAILQLKRTDETVAERFASRKELDSLGIEPCFDHYEVVYIAPLENTDNQAVLLESLYEKFNLYHPESFRGHSLAVSDIVALKQHDVVTCHYLKNAEMAMEDDYGMIDGVINNGKASVLEKLKEPPVVGAIAKSAKCYSERELE